MTRRSRIFWLSGAALSAAVTARAQDMAGDSPPPAQFVTPPAPERVAPRVAEAPASGGAAPAAQDKAAPADDETPQPIQTPADMSGAPVDADIEAETEAADAMPRDINPYDRDIPMTAPLNFNRSVLGEIPIILTRDDYVLIERSGFLDLVEPLLTPQGAARLTEVLEGHDRFRPDILDPLGMSLEYDPNLLSLLILRIDPRLRAVQSLFQTSTPEEPGEPPNDFAAYLNSSVTLTRRESTGDIDPPGLFLNGAVNWRNLVFEADVQGREEFITDEYVVERNYARFVYDQPEAFRRWYLGDLDPQIRMRQGFIDIGGLGVERQRRRFDPYRFGIIEGNRNILLQEESTVRVLRNGALIREFRLDAGQYDLNELPLLTGSNEFDIEIEDSTGLVQTVNYSAYLDAIDLEPGDYEYAAYIGMTAPPAFGSPDYSDGDLAFTGYFRKAFINRPALGVGLQASEAVQMVSGQTQYILPQGARLRLDGGASHSEEAGEGYAVTTSFDLIIDRSVALDGLTLQGEYISEDFSTLSDPSGFNPFSWTFSGQYTRSFNENWLATLDGNYSVSRTDRGDTYRLGASTTYRFSRQWSGRIGVNYTDFGSASRNDGFGVLASLVWRPGLNHRADARYDSATNSGSVSYSKSPSNRVGGFGYSARASYDDGPANLSGSAVYIANRFDAGISHTVFGRDFDSLGDEQITSMRVTSALAFTGGRFAVGRRIGDSFALLYPHETLENRSVIVGETLDGGYYAKSGAFGPALQGQLGSYVNNSILYDVEDVPRGYDIGEGISRVYPRYRSGYTIEVGTDAYVSALGTLNGLGDAPVALASGRVFDLNAPDAEPMLFFTNSVGRFAIQGLTPGHEYSIELSTRPPATIRFEVPADSEGLLDLQTLTAPIVPE